MKKKFISTILCITMLSVILVGCGEKKEEASKSKNEETKQKEITVVARPSFFPITYTDDNGDLTGFEVEAIKEVAKRAGFKIKWEISDDYTAMFGGIDSGLYDTIVGQVAITPEREKTYNFSDKYTANKIRMCVRKDDPAESVDDLRGRKVHIQFGTVLQTFFDAYNKDLPENEKIQCVEIDGSPYEELEVGHSDAFPITELSFDAVMEKGEYDFKLVGDPIIVDYTAWPFSKDADPELIEGFNKAIKEMQEDGTFRELSEKFYKRDVTDVSGK